MSTVQVQLLSDRIGPAIAKRDTSMRKAISVHEHVLPQYVFRIPPCTIGKIVKEVTNDIFDFLREDYLKAPNDSGSCYYKYKGSHNIVLLAVVDVEYRFMYVDVGCIGRISYGGVFANCSLHNALEAGSVQLPPPFPLSGRRLPVPFYLKPMNIPPCAVNYVVLAICVPHNFLLSNASRSIYLCHGFVDAESTDVRNTQPGDWRKEGFPTNTFFPLQRARQYMGTLQKYVREELKEHYMTLWLQVLPERRSHACPRAGSQACCCLPPSQCAIAIVNLPGYKHDQEALAAVIIDDLR
ncbi:hypothetical protein PR048_015529 [Dryococelus australis]|uniref:DDE Tnp4 domain-containing protein n=1 Tax=Dryococelus australis TaxID=614101 RepID=A0ABQ9HHH2_9NEOP|nr:hypothetical protein PR048_015529 [Dryococelus australis]